MERDIKIFLLVATNVLIASSTGVHLGLSWGPIRTDRILTRVTSASKEILFTMELVEEAHEFAPGYMSAGRP